MMRIAVLGGGITGLTTAYYLHRAGCSVDVFEAAAEPGGTMRSRREGPYLTELGPNSLLLTPELERLLTDLDLMSEVVEPPAALSAGRFVLRNGAYQRLPSSPPALLTSGFFGWRTKLALLRELLRPAAPAQATETVAQFFRRRFNQEIVDYAVNPFVAGIYAGDPQQLLVGQAFPKLVELEQTHGSVLRGLAKAGAGQRRRTVSLRGGLQMLPQALASCLAENLYFHQPVEALVRDADGLYHIYTPGVPFADRGYDKVVLALPAPVSARLLEPFFPEESEAIGQVTYPAMAVVHTAYCRADVTHPLQGFGALHPRVEGTYTAGSIWSSALFPDRCPADQVLFTTFVGGAQSPEAGLDAETQMLPRVHAELCQLYGIRAAAPQWQRRYLWEKAIPQADAHLGPARAATKSLATQGIETVSNWQAGISVPDCIRHACQLAEKISAEASR